MKTFLSPTRPLKVCVVAPSLAKVGGQSRQAARLLKGLSSEPLVETAFIPHDPRLTGPYRMLQRIKFIRTLVTSMRYWAILAVQLRTYDVVHVFSASYYSYLLSAAPAILMGKLYGKRVVLNYRSGEAEDHLRRWPLTTLPVMRCADRIIVPSAYLVGVFAKFGLKAQAIFNTVELDAFSFRARTPLTPKFLCSRSLEPLYNVENVIRAFRLIQQEYPEAALTIAGDGSQRQELERLTIRLDLQHVQFVGYVPFERMPTLYDNHDIHLIGNDLDNMPAAVIESGATGIALVTTNAGGIPHLVTHEESALIVDTGDYVGLAREALRLLRDPELALRLADSARANVQQFTWLRVREQWLDLYGELYETGRHSPRGMGG